MLERTLRIGIVTDAWQPQVNGVVTTLSRTAEVLRTWGHEIRLFTPAEHRTLPCPTYPEIRLALLPGAKLRRELLAFAPDAMHVATEGPLGSAARRLLASRGLAFTTSYHTQFPEYLRKRLPIPRAWSYAYLRRHHGAASRTLVATERQREALQRHGFRNVVLWSRGVDAELFRPCGRDALDVRRPIWAYAGRVAIEKNLEAFLELDLPGTKVVVGAGPDLDKLARGFPAAHFTGYRFGPDLARLLSSADVFVFPSRTDTFGLVMLEALACGTPVAAYPIAGPLDVVVDGVTGVLSEDLGAAARAALGLDREACRAAALERSWQAAAAQFISHLVDTRTGQALDGAADEPQPTAPTAPAVSAAPAASAASAAKSAHKTPRAISPRFAPGS